MLLIDCEAYGSLPKISDASIRDKFLDSSFIVLRVPRPRNQNFRIEFNIRWIPELPVTNVTPFCIRHKRLESFSGF